MENRPGTLPDGPRPHGKDAARDQRRPDRSHQAPARGVVRRVVSMPLCKGSVLVSSCHGSGQVDRTGLALGLDGREAAWPFLRKGEEKA